jgi:membrane protein required for colicin V production
LLDAFCLIVIVGFSFWGLVRGLIREAFSLGGLILGIWLGMSLNGAVGGFLAGVLGMGQEFAQPIAFALIFVIIAIAMTWLGIIISKLSHIALLGWLDRFTGLIFGFCKGLLIASVGCVVLVAIPFTEMDRNVEESKIGPLVVGIAPATYNTFFGGGGFDLRGMMRKYLSDDEHMKEENKDNVDNSSVTKDGNKAAKKDSPKKQKR